MTAILALTRTYLFALRSARAKDTTINYLKLKSDPAIVLLFNPITGDGMFSSAIDARTAMPDGYYLIYPWIEFAETLDVNTANLRQYGWPAYETEGV